MEVTQEGLDRVYKYRAGLVRKHYKLREQGEAQKSRTVLSKISSVNSTLKLLGLPLGPTN